MRKRLPYLILILICSCSTKKDIKEIFDESQSFNDNNGISVIFASGFENTSVCIIQNDSIIYKDVISTEYSNGAASEFIDLTEHSDENQLQIAEIEINNQFLYVKSKYNYVYISISDNVIIMNYTNKLPIFD